MVQEGWHIAKSVPATLLLGLITQAGAIVWTVSMMMADIQENQTDIVEFGQRISKVEQLVQSPSCIYGTNRREHRTHPHISRKDGRPPR